MQRHEKLKHNLVGALSLAYILELAEGLDGLYGHLVSKRKEKVYWRLTTLIYMGMGWGNMKLHVIE